VTWLMLGLQLAPPPAARPRPPPAQAPPAQAQPQTITGGKVELVTVDVVVTDKKGVPVTGLTAADFTIEEEGDRQAVSSFEAVELPRAPARRRRRPRVSTNRSHQSAAPS
jgi:hypothetical protein